ncbi:hypothetical protein GG681_16490 [Epibacterium sp. SM1969]|uniref:Uncharacterized protein n=1 Tax=Tritonibacter aquimaris TaxID=2663379 RepID=A0A844AWI0_9RHOB|nr:hypothetical protein [Tritonibacter aquimaris]MQY44247.1 hypothetical protein [Tritonibacter aquimaris]
MMGKTFYDHGPLNTMRGAFLRVWRCGAVLQMLGEKCWPGNLNIADFNMRECCAAAIDATAGAENPGSCI